MRTGISGELMDVAMALCLMDDRVADESKAFLRMTSARLADCAAEVHKMEGFITSGGPNRATVNAFSGEPTA